MLSEISIVIPSFNNEQIIAQCLENLADQVPECEIIVLDCESSDRSLESAEGFLPRLKSLRVFSIKNYGWAHATNTGFLKANGKYLLAMNSDAFITRSALENMFLRFQRDPSIAAAAPTLVSSYGSTQQNFGWLYFDNYFSITRPRKVTLVHGSCVLISRTALEIVGMFDENFFFYNEEFDWCWRAARLGYRFERISDKVTHLQGNSTPKNPKFQLEGYRGALYLVNKHFPKWISALTCAGFELLGWLGKSLDPRDSYRSAWNTLHHIAQQKAFLESPFYLSGRGTPSTGRTPSIT